ncbi:DUF3078 domain-containing protein [Ferruginibacter lapsinanis]|uniref:DUF3078 domain-containing protein n=1 Tax=Ferruginibacter lapsinanis TaxID=563172 RepID=UPI001E5D7D89|nr:DUF3078 domain-containing protein [Ferruginibacter lapsinanis]UEG50410.1 DUF3078 domain-containing protein [Ferruginibacter lapsinanis]
MKKTTRLFIICTLLMNAARSQGTTDNAIKFTGEVTANLTKNKTELKDGWTKGGTINVAVNESGRNDYWIKGGEQFAIGIKGILDYNFDRKKGKASWLNSFRARYGVTRATSTGKKFLKNDDYLNFSSTFGSEFKKSWSYAGFLSLESQFEQYFLTPGYIKLGPGILYKPNESFNLLISPAMVNLTTKLAPSLKPVNAFGVDSGKTLALGLGAFVQAKCNKDIDKGINYKSVATVYSNYLDHPGNMVLDWSNLFTLTVNKLIGATVSINARYNDFEVGRLQLQHSIGVGLSYKL